MIARIQKRLQEKAEGTEKGFTLVELLVVIIIIGILAAIAIPLYLNQQKKAKDSTAESDLANFRLNVVSQLTEDPSATPDPAEFTASPDNTPSITGTGDAMCLVISYTGGTNTAVSTNVDGQVFENGTCT